MSRLGPHSIRRLGLLAAAAVSILAGLLAWQGAALSRLEGESIDARFAIRGSSVPSDVAVVAVDEKTFSDLRQQWPFHRALHAQMIDRLRREGVAQIVYDVQFTEPTDPTDDLALFHASGRAGHVIFATTEVDAEGHSDVLGGESNLAQIGAVAAAANLPAESGGVIRRYPRSELGLPGMAAAAARLVHRSVPRSAFESGTAWIDFRGPTGTVPTYSFSDVLAGRVPASKLAGRVVIVGASVPTLQDLHPTSTSDASPMPGPEIQANAIWTALHGNPLRSTPGWLAALAIVLAALTAPAVATRGRLLAAIAAGLIVAAAYTALAQLEFDRGHVLVVAYPLLTFALSAFATTAASYLAAFVERNGFARQLRDSHVELIQRLAQAVEHRDLETGAHIRRIGIFSERLALAAGWSRREAEMLRHATAMHDVGKIGIPDAILLKPGALDESEWEVIRSHTTIGGEILAKSANPLVQLAETVARCHHERWDGGGYPSGLSGSEIPESARICAICDAFDALLSARSYKSSWTLEEALAEISRSSGSHFDPRLVEIFLPLAPGLVARAESDPRTSPAPTAITAPA